MGSIGPTMTDSRPPLGLIASEMNIHRAPGDIGNRRTFDFPVLQTEIKGALLVSMVTDEEHDDDMINAFVDAGNRLIEQGAIGLVTSCGFWAISQKKLSRRLSVPVATSSLLQIPMIRTIIHPDQGIGILTFDKERLNFNHLKAVGVHDLENIYISGPPTEGRMKHTLRDGIAYDLQALTEEVVETAKQLTTKHPHIGAILLECTQFPPFASAVQQATGLPVWDVSTLANWFYAGLVSKPQPVMTKEEALDASLVRPRSDIEKMEKQIRQ